MKYKVLKKGIALKFYAGIGSRETPEHVLHQMQKIGRVLGQLGWTLRSGGALGADTAFEVGAVSTHDGPSPQIFLPWQGFNNHRSMYVNISDEAFHMAEKYHPAWSRLSQGAQKLQARNCYQILGYDLMTPSSFVVCWTKDGKATGGTGQAIRIAEDRGISVFNLFHPNAIPRLQEFLKPIF